MNGIDIDAVHYQPERRKGPARKPIRDLILAKVNKAGGMSRAGIIARTEHSRRDEAARELDRMVGEGVVFRFSRHSGNGMPAVSFFACRADGERWQAEGDGRKVPTFKPARQGKPLAPVHEQTKGLGWRNMKPPKDAPAVTPSGVKPQVLVSQPVYSRHQVKPGEAVPSVVSAEQCRPWARQCLGGAS
jgi:hypothetical protein